MLFCSFVKKYINKFQPMKYCNVCVCVCCSTCICYKTRRMQNNKLLLSHARVVFPCCCHVFAMFHVSVLCVFLCKSYGYWSLLCVINYVLPWTTGNKCVLFKISLITIVSLFYFLTIIVCYIINL